MKYDDAAIFWFLLTALVASIFLYLNLSEEFDWFVTKILVLVILYIMVLGHIIFGPIIVVWYVLKGEVFTEGDVWTSGEGAAVLLTLVGVVQLIPWMFAADDTGVPPGVRFFASFHRHRGHAKVDRALGRHAPTFDGEGFNRTVGHSPGGSYASVLEAEELAEMAVRAEKQQADLLATEERLRDQMDASVAKQKQKLEIETRVITAEAELHEKMVEVEQAKARIAELQKQVGKFK